jgi:hypothetical protein
VSSYTNELSARSLIRYIANDYIELSQEKIRSQRDDYIKICRDWLDKNLVYRNETYKKLFDIFHSSRQSGDIILDAEFVYQILRELEHVEIS